MYSESLANKLMIGTDGLVNLTTPFIPNHKANHMVQSDSLS